MPRYCITLHVMLLSLCFGCGEAKRPVAEVRPSVPAVSETVETTESPELKAVPAEGPSRGSSSARAKEVFAEIVRAAEAGDAEAWTKAEGELHELGLATVSALTDRLSDTNPIARELAAMFLAQLGPDASPAAEGLLKLLRDDSTFARVNAAAALSTFDGYSERVAPVLAELLSDEDINVRITAATSLRNVGPSAKSAINGLTRSLLDADARVRAASATTLGELGPLASSSLPTLKRLGDDEDTQVQTAAIRAIKRIDETERTPAVAIPASATE